MNKLKIGKIVGTHGLKGELKIKSNSDFNEQRFKKGNCLIINYNNQDEELTIATVRVHKGNYLISFKDLQNINFVEKYLGCFVYGKKEDIELDDGEFLYSDLIGCVVVNNNDNIGVVDSITTNGPQDILVVKTDKKNILIPYVDAFIKDVNIDRKEIQVELIRGFIDED